MPTRPRFGYLNEEEIMNRTTRLWRYPFPSMIVMATLLATALGFGEAVGLRTVRPAHADPGCQLNSADGTCRISVADEGSGIPPDVVEKIFEPFFTTKHRGTGLGLPITKRTIEQHGGSIAIDSTQGHGTTIVVTLPLEHPEIIGRNTVGRVEQG